MTVRPRRAASVLVVLVLLCVGALASCEWPPNSRYVDQVFTQVSVTKDVLYRQTTDYAGNPIDLELDVYQPVGDTRTTRPAVMWMYGGYWVSGAKEDMLSFATDSALRGYVGVSINYRLRPDAVQNPVPAMVAAYQDALAAVQWLQAHAATYGIDPGAIFAGGFSAGAINALNLAFVASPSPIAGAVSFSGETVGTPAAGAPPVILWNGADDTLVPPANAQRACDLTVQAGNVCEIHVLPGLGHSLDRTQFPTWQAAAHQFLFEQVLVGKGYTIGL